MSFSVFNRHKELETAKSVEFDLVIIGGGITGAGIALDAASRGMSVALFEKQDFSAGTSSRSTKLIHGGLRYLKQGEFALVREVGLERAIVHKNATHLVIPEKMIIPLIEGGTFGKWATSFGLWVYDKLANVKDEDKRQMLTKEETLRKEPLLKDDIVLGSGYYAEYRTDDARLTIEIMKSAHSFGALCFNYAECTGFTYQDKKVNGITIHDHLQGISCNIKAKTIINAAGPWVDEVRSKDNLLKGKRLHLTKGIHLVIPHEKFPVTQSIYFDVPDGRMIFAIPRAEVTYIGTTDTDYHAQKEEPNVTLQDVEYLLNAVKPLFPSIKLQKEDIISSWSGLRPLIHEEGKSASELSRKDEIFISDSGLISIAGGKLTGYRKMAQKAVDKASQHLTERHHLAFKKCMTEKINLSGNIFKNSDEVNSYIEKLSSDFSLSPQESTRLVHTYGANASSILTDAKAIDKEWANALIHAEVSHCITQEYCVHLVDFFRFRTGMLYFYPQHIEKLLAPALKAFHSITGCNDDTLSTEKQLVMEAMQKVLEFD
jgi:glycerol-3-phosphate dehydrogenase